MKIEISFSKIFLTICIIFSFHFAKSQDYVKLINSQELLKKGYESFKEEKYKEAIDFYAQVPEGDTNYFVAQYEITYSYYKLENYEEVVKQSRKLLHEGSGEVQQYSILGSSLDELKKHEEAIAAYEEGLKYFPYNLNLLLNRALVFESMGDMQKAYEAYQSILKVSPLYPSIHLRLAFMAEREEKYTQAIMAFTTYLLLQPSGERSISTIDEFNKLCNKSSSIIGSAKTKVLKNEFEDLDFLISNQVALNDKFKVPGKFKFPLNRQLYLVLEKLNGMKENENGGFYSEFYLPFFADFKKTQNFEHFSLLMLAASNNDKITSEVSKNIDNLKKSRQAGLDKLKEMHPTLEIAIYGKKENLAIWYYNNFTIEALGNRNIEKKNVGNWATIHEDGYIDLIGQFDQNGNRTGTWYYFKTGKDTAKVMVYKNNEADGPFRIYSDGKISEIGNYKNGKIDGLIVDYYADGSISSKENFENDLRNGGGVQYFATGNLKYEYTFKNGLIDGNLKEYYSHGALKEEKNFKDGKQVGSAKYYYENKQLNRESNYVNDVLEGPYKTYYQNGKVKSEGIAAKGNTSGKWTEYFSDGKISKLSFLDELGKINGEEEYYDHLGRKYNQDTYVKGDWKRTQFFDPSGKVISDQKIGKSATKVVSYNMYLNKRFEGTFVNGEREGLCTFYRNNGDISSTEIYKKGKLEGVSKTYNDNGTVSGEYNYKNDNREGLEIRFHPNGKLSSQGNYMNGDKYGEWKNYEIDGSLSEKVFYQAGQKTGWSYNYFSNGKLLKKNKYTNGLLSEVYQCDTNGNIIDSAIIVAGTGRFTLKGISGEKYYEGGFVNGLAEGKVIFYYPNGTKNVMYEYHNGYLNGDCFAYHPNGKLQRKYKMFHGDEEGKWEYFNYFGEKTRTIDYKNGLNHGKNIYYYTDGKVESESEIYEDERNNISTYYAQSGEVREIRYYQYGRLMGYSYIGKNGKPVDTIFAVNGDAKVKAYYANGNVSTTFEIKAGQYHGELKIYYPNGSLQEERYYDHGDEIKPTIEYYIDGKIRRKDTYLHGTLHGETIENNPNGSKRLKENYVNGNLEGLCEYFDATGKRIQAYYYMQNDVIKILQ
jgi:antitoxin component YwqK of YwqJK toxin-antitoxin module